MKIQKEYLESEKTDHHQSQTPAYMSIYAFVFQELGEILIFVFLSNTIFVSCNSNLLDEY